MWMSFPGFADKLLTIMVKDSVILDFNNNGFIISNYVFELTILKIKTLSKGSNKVGWVKWGQVGS